MQGFDYEYNTFKTAVNMFECIEIEESIYEVVVEPYYKNLLRHIPAVLVIAGRLEENPTCQILTPK